MVSDIIMHWAGFSNESVREKSGRAYFIRKGDERTSDHRRLVEFNDKIEVDDLHIEFLKCTNHYNILKCKSVTKYTG